MTDEQPLLDVPTPSTLPWSKSLRGGAVFVPGVPRPQGSHKAYVVNGHAKVVESNEHTNPWRADIHSAVREVITGDAIVYPTESVAVTLLFVMPRRKNEPKGVTPPHLRAPDTDKLARAAIDSLIGLVYSDDAQVTDIRARKRTARLGEPPGVHLYWRLGIDAD